MDQSQDFLIGQGPLDELVLREFVCGRRGEKERRQARLFQAAAELRLASAPRADVIQYENTESLRPPRVPPPRDPAPPRGALGLSVILQSAFRCLASSGGLLNI